MKKFIVLKSSSNTKKYPLDKDKIIIGRDKACDIIIEGENISRQHAAILSSFGSYYLENLSQSGAISKNNEVVEYVEIKPNDIFKIENFEFHFVESGEPVISNSESLPNRKEDDGSLKPFSENVENNLQADSSFEIAPISAESVAGENSSSSDVILANAHEGPQFPEVSPDNMNSQEPNLGDVANIQSTKIISTQISESPTKIVDTEEKFALLKITKGEQIGREIKLNQGLQWTVGRGTEAEVQVDNGKLSRAHFKIVKIGAGYRVQDLGSSNGTRLNGIAITDAPLQVFDTIKAGPLEMQFLIVDAGQRLSTEAVATDNTQHSESFSEKTAFAPPQLFRPQESSSNSSDSQSFPKFQMPTDEASYADPRENSIRKLTASEKIKNYWNKQPAGRKKIYVALLILILVLVFLPNSKKTTPTNTETNTEVTDANSPSSSIANSVSATNSEVSPEFNLKSEDEKRRIEELYLKAQQAKAKQDWKTAFEAASEILKEVKKYKNAADILDEAQTYLNESQIGSLSRNISAIESMKEENSNKVDSLLSAGENALKEGRWDDAQESFTKALTLDPDNERAKLGFTAAHAKDAGAIINVKDIPNETPQPNQQNDLSYAEKDALTELEKVYQTAKVHIQEGQFRQSIPQLNTLEEQITAKLEAYNDHSRTPNSVSDEMLPRAKALLSSIREAKDRINSEFRMEYQGLMSDAEIAISNKQYIQSREIYDNIIRKDPDYLEPVEARRKLYKLILTEAKNTYQEGLIYESVSDVPNAVESLEKTLSLLDKIDDYTARRYQEKAEEKLRTLKR